MGPRRTGELKHTEAVPDDGAVLRTFDSGRCSVVTTNASEVAIVAVRMRTEDPAG